MPLDNKSPIINIAQGESPKAAGQAMGAAAAVGRDDTITKFAVKGNIHEAPTSATPPIGGKPAPLTPPTIDLMRPVGTVTEEQRTRTSRRFTETEVLDPALQSAIDGVRSDTKLSKLGTMGAQIQSQLTKHITELYDQQKSGLELIPVLDAAGKPVLGADGQPTYKAKDGVAEAADAMAAPEMTDATRTLLDKLSKATTDAERNEIMGQIGEGIGVVNPVTGAVSISYDAIANLMDTPDEAVGEIIAKGLSDNVNVDANLLRDLGYSDSDAADVFDMLGFDPANPPTLKTFRDSVTGYIEQAVAPVEREFAKVNDPFASASEREDALENLRDMGYTGTLASKETLNTLSKSIAEAGTNIVLGNKTFDTLEDALSDDGVTWLISGYINGTIKKEDMPAGLVNVVEQNRDAMEDIVQTLKTDVKAFDDVQKQWSSAKLGVDDATMKMLIPGYDPSSPYHTTPPDLTKVSGIGNTILSPTTSPEVKTAAVSTVQSITGLNLPPAITSTIISGMSSADINTLTNPVTGTAARNAYVSTLQLGNQVDNAIAAVPKAKLVSKKITDKIDFLEKAFGITDVGDAITGLSSLAKRTDDVGKSAQAILDTLDKLLSDGMSVSDVANSLDILQTNLGVGTVDTRNANFNSWKDVFAKASTEAQVVQAREAARVEEEKAATKLKAEEDARQAKATAEAEATKAAADEELQRAEAEKLIQTESDISMATAAAPTTTYGNTQFYSPGSTNRTGGTKYMQRDVIVNGKVIGQEWRVGNKWTSKKPT